MNGDDLLKNLFRTPMRTAIPEVLMEEMAATDSPLRNGMPYFSEIALAVSVMPD